MALKVEMKQSSKPLTIKSTTHPGSLSGLTDVSLNENLESGTTVVYNESSGKFETRKVFDYIDENVTINGGSF